MEAGDGARESAGAENATRGARWTLAGLSLAGLLPALNTSIAHVALPALSEAFGASFQAVQWIVLSYLLAITTLIVGAGRLGDIVGRRRLLLGGIALFIVASGLCGAAATLGQLIAARAGQGVGAAIMTALAISLLGEAVPKAKTGSAMGLFGTMSAVGTALGPSVGGALISGLGWRAIFLVNVPLGALALWLAGRSLPCDRPRAKLQPAGFDALGTLLLALTLAAYALGVTMGRGRFGAFNLGLLLSAAGGAGLFVFVEARAASPLIRLTLFRDRALRASVATSGLVATVIMATLVVGPFYLSGALGLEPAMVGLAMSAGPLVAALSGVPAGRAVDRLGGRRMGLTGLCGMALGAFALAALPAKPGVGGYLAPIALITASYALFQTANNTVVMRGVSADERGVVSGVLNLARNLGLITGASVMGAVFAVGTGQTDIAAARGEAVAAGMRTTFVAAGLLIAVALVIAVRGQAKEPR